MAYPPTRDKSFALTGGLDLISSMKDKGPGSLLSGNNIQIISGQNGYSRIDGFERCTDNTLASNAEPVYLLVADNTATINAGDAGSSGGISVVCLAAISGPGEKVVPVVCSDQDEDFSSISTITFSGGSIDIDSVVSAETYFANSEIGTIRSLAKDYYLSFIPEIPGSGDVPGGFRLRGVSYVFREGHLYKGGVLSWTEISMPDVMYFDSGISALEVGDVITDGSETATIASVTRQTGSWNHTYEEAEQSAGYFTITGATGDFTAGNDLVVSGGTVPAFVNGDFATDSDWTKGAGCTIASSKATVAAHSDEDVISQAYVLSDGDVLKLTIVLSGVTAGTITPRINSDDGLPDEGTELSADGTHVVLIAATKDITIFELAYDADFLGSVESVTAAVGRKAKVKTANETYVLPSGGRYEVETYNFTNIEDNESAFGVSGSGPAFEFDGTNYIPIYHPDTDSFPNHLMIHQERLHLCFPGGEKPYSISGSPRIFNPLLGAGTHSTGKEITGCTSIYGNAAIVLCTSERWLLLGDGIYNDTSATRNWQFYRHTKEEGGEPFTLVGGDTIAFASGGSIYSLTATDTAGSYYFKDVSEMFAPALVDKIGMAVCAVWVSAKSQYRIFFDNGKGICLSFRGGNVIGATPIELSVAVSNIWKSVEGGKEHIFFTASDSPYLYKMDSGDSMDGEYILGSIRLPFHSYGSPRHEKEFPQVVIELSAPVLISEDTTINYTVNFDHGSPLSPLPVVHTAEDIESVGGMFGANAGYGNFVWSGPVVSEIFAYIDGYGSNMSLLVTFSTKNDLTFAFQSVSVDYIIHGRKGRG
jgi:hypothetical protein